MTHSKIKKIIEIEGFKGELGLYQHSAETEFTYNKGICMLPGCDFTIDLPTRDHVGYCEKCETDSVYSWQSIMGFGTCIPADMLKDESE